MKMTDRPGRDAPDMGVSDETFVYRDEITRLKQEIQGHINHIAMLKATLKAERVEADAMRAALRPFAKEFNDWDGVGCWDEMTLDDMFRHAPGEIAGVTFADLRRAAALLEKS